jgi:hypothetical protein
MGVLASFSLPNPIFLQLPGVKDSVSVQDLVSKQQFESGSSER